MVIPTIRKNTYGFTLLELLIVISIIGILVTVATASYSSSQQKARNSRRMSDVKNIQNALEQYYSDNDATYPAESGGQASLSTTYMPAGWPSDPKPGRVYEYTTNATFDSYFACAQMEGSNGNATSDDGSGYPNGTGYYCVKNLQ
jgi:type II secretion system protein G